MKLQLKEIAKLIGGKVYGDDSILITGAGEIETAKPGEISFMINKSYLKKAKVSKASAIVVPAGLEGLETPRIEVEKPFHSFIKILEIISKEKMNSKTGVHETVIFGEGANFGNEISLAPYVVIGNEVSIGEKSVIGSNSSIGDRVRIGDNCLIYPNVVIADDSVVGNNVIIHSGTVIGSDGCGFVPDKGVSKKVPHIGIVVIEDDVELGSNCTVDRATMSVTRICKGTKLDNQVHVAHNCTIGEHSILLAHCTLGGGTQIGKYAIFSGQVGTVDNVTIGDHVTIGEKAAVTKDMPGNMALWGNPAHPLNDEKKVIVLSRKLPEMFATVNKLNQRISELESKLM